MFNKILIANRGEIACRVIRTARQLGIHSVAIYSTADKHSQHVLQADSAYWIGDAPAKASYLNIDAIISAAKASGAEAIHPGYGFLSENPLFAQACAEAGIVFIGPPASAMQAMGSKQLAKQMLEKTNVPLTPGYHGGDQSDERLLNEALQIGFPVLLKAACGGGGKGMRAVYSEAEFSQALASARRESMASFADDTMLIEKLITNPRHVEVQIMADNQGQVVHLFERDCSIQRRHQKIIEEAPAPNLPHSLRQSLAEAACEVARSIDYRGAGTVEFLVDANEHFYFMEMNTRLQVEHPVTEMITGYDLVAWQLKIAAGEPVPLTQDKISAKGHAIECRIYAEDPHQGFIPSIGQIDFLKEPDGEGIRIDSGVACHSDITKHYDPMIAKLIAWGETREQALQRLRQALKHFAIGGVKSNIPFLLAICEHPRFSKADLSTDFLSQEKVHFPKPNVNLAVLMAAGYDYLMLTQNNDDALFHHSFAWQMHLSSHWSWRYLIGEQQLDVTVTPSASKTLKLKLNEEEFAMSVWIDHDRLYLNDGQQIHQSFVANEAGSICLYTEQGPLIIERFDWQNFGAQSAAKRGQLTAPMPATVVAILKNKGDTVKEGDSLIVLEAMKMEHTIHAPKDGILVELYYEVGSQVNEGAELLALKD
ncbi:acetyl/propionyl/methylcrotonyl-CoA carboxylase subunit alpha [Legionella micdadei]|uniref:Biotin carboxylase n=1 Tax=Legionella micdadei TaxID=451 RepID=A0A098GCS8_LEGMI|nr:acetyl/propionyl/methylcrotonyl-CoA carboxylase subunit alpha [Legionella micdadei]ARG98084.1 3-methylcrotonyl-CoA carboxylase [Legionella micdadei]ARH00881.1 3-methylcrotonyl-CoA carboxylase [Legionella micdadei]KTD30083.1 acyl CoA carboxylase subunit alpha [Legionella micdadei]NSL18542.1 acetyl/propionyl/methylcrotonyl-CoA carboxylase subunit alpha [Legionella micdadei]CEG60278.1 Methylcrotonoyl-CoA carboxylase subunit alpha, mitochondrial [Legionella micdadei]